MLVSPSDPKNFFFSSVFITRQHALQCMQSAILLWKICPSVCMSHAGIVQNECTYRQDSLHYMLGSWLVFLRSAAVTAFQRTRSAWALVGRFAIFDRNHRLSRKRYKTGSWLLWITNRKSYVADRSGSVSMTSSDFERRDANGKVFGAYPLITLVQLYAEWAKLAR